MFDPTPRIQNKMPITFLEDNFSLEITSEGKKIEIEPIPQNQKSISNFIEDKEKSIRSLAQNFDSHAIKLEKLQSTLPSDISGIDFNPSLAGNNSNISNFHQEQFNNYYSQYIKSYLDEFLLHETIAQKKIRQNFEIEELQKIHQKQNEAKYFSFGTPSQSKISNANILDSKDLLISDINANNKSQEDSCLSFIKKCSVESKNQTNEKPNTIKLQENSEEKLKICQNSDKTQLTSTEASPCVIQNYTLTGNFARSPFKEPMICGNDENFKNYSNFKEKNEENTNNDRIDNRINDKTIQDSHTPSFVMHCKGKKNPELNLSDSSHIPKEMDSFQDIELNKTEEILLISCQSSKDILQNSNNDYFFNEKRESVAKSTKKELELPITLNALNLASNSLAKEEEVKSEKTRGKSKKEEDLDNIYKIIDSFKLSNPIYKSASTNKAEEIKVIQMALNLLELDEVIYNGHYGVYTEKLVKTFQEKNGLIADGIVDENCWQNMKAEINKKKKTSLDDEKRKKKLEAEEAKKMKINQQTLESTQTLSQMESRIFNEL